MEREITIKVVQSGFIVEMNVDGYKETHATGSKDKLINVIRNLIVKEIPEKPVSKHRLK